MTSSIFAATDNAARPLQKTLEVRGVQDTFDCSQCEPTAERLRPAESTTEQNAPEESAVAATAQLAAAALQQRPAKMFVTGSGRVFESGEGAAVKRATNGLVKIAFLRPTCV